MSYGLFDCDIQNYNSMFNLELMKLASYFKQKGEIVVYSPTFSPERFDHFIIGKDIIDEKFNYPIYEYKNIETVGKFFTRKKYFPLLLAAEEQQSDTYIYEKNFIRHRHDYPKATRSFYKSQFSADHIRMSLDGENLWDNYDKQLKYSTAKHNISVYDYDIANVNGALNTLKDIVTTETKKDRPIVFKFPIKLNKTEEIEPWLYFHLYGHYTVFQIQKRLEKEDIKILSSYGDKVKRITIQFNITKDTTFDNFCENLKQIYQDICFLQTICPRISLIYEEEFFKDKRWKDVIDLFNMFMHHCRVKKENFHSYCKTMYGYAVRCAKFETKEKVDFIKNTFLFVAQNNYPLFKDFYEHEVK